MKCFIFTIGLSALTACSGHTSVEVPTGGINGSVVVHEEIENFWLDDARLYWVARSGALKSCLKDGCNGAVSYGQSDSVVALGADRIFWEFGTEQWALVTCPKTGCTGAPSVVLQPPNVVGYNLSADGDYVYWSSEKTIYRCQSRGCGAAPEVVAAEPAYGEFAFTNTDVYWVSWDANQPSSVTSIPPRIRRAPKDGSQPATTVVASLERSALASLYPSVFALDSSNVYWVGDSNHIVSCPLARCADSAPTQVVTSNDSKAGLRVDATGVYWQQADLSNKSSVRYCPFSGCSTNAVTVTSSNVYSFALDDSDIYWADTNHGGNGFTQNIHRVAKATP